MIRGRYYALCTAWTRMHCLYICCMHGAGPLCAWVDAGRLSRSTAQRADTARYRARNVTEYANTKKRDKKYNPLRHLKHTKIKTFAQYLNCFRVKCQSYSREELRRLVFFRSYVKSVQSPVECSLCTFFSLCESCTAPRTHARHAHRECKSG